MITKRLFDWLKRKAHASHVAVVRNGIDVLRQMVIEFVNTFDRDGATDNSGVNFILFWDLAQS